MKNKLIKIFKLLLIFKSKTKILKLIKKIDKSKNLIIGFGITSQKPKVTDRERI